MSEFEYINATPEQEAYREGYLQGIIDHRKEVESGEYAKKVKRCPICPDCPDNCPLDKEQNNE